jgi:hypothetical protein
MRKEEHDTEFVRGRVTQWRALEEFGFQRHFSHETFPVRTKRQAGDAVHSRGRMTTAGRFFLANRDD